MSNPTKPAWGSYADLKRIQREREQREQLEREKAAAGPPAAPTEPAPPLASTPANDSGHPQSGHPVAVESSVEFGPPISGHPNSGQPQIGHLHTGHPDSGQPQTGHPIDSAGTQSTGTQLPATQELVTQSPVDRAPGHPNVGVQVPEARVPADIDAGHPGTQVPGTQYVPPVPPREPLRRPSMAADGAESPYWPSRQYKTRLNLRFPGDLAQQLEDYCRRQGLSKQDATEIAIRRLLADDRVANRAPGHPLSRPPQTGHPVGWVPEKAHDHDHEDDDRIIIYQQMTGNRVNARDRAALAEVRHLHTDVIREGIRLSLERAPAPVKSLRYCLGAILEVAGRGTAAAPAKRPPAMPEAPPARTFEETVLLARAVARQLRLDHPTVDAAEVRSHLRAWTADQNVENADAVVESALAAERIGV